MTDPKKKPLNGDTIGRTGRIVVDDRGRNIWEWFGDAPDGTVGRLKLLENAELELECAEPKDADKKKATDPGGGFDPYGHS